MSLYIKNVIIVQHSLLQMKKNNIILLYIIFVYIYTKDTDVISNLLMYVIKYSFTYVWNIYPLYYVVHICVVLCVLNIV